MRRNLGNQFGDTIVEIMIVLSVLGMALSISYATANRSLLSTRGAHESAEATELLKSQIENLRVLSGNPAADYNIYQAFPNDLFCINSEGKVEKTFTGSDLEDPTHYPDNCKFNDRYYISIKRTDPPEDQFTVKAVWDDVQGYGKDKATLNYRLHKLDE